MKAQLLFRDRRNHTQTFSLKAEESILGRDAGIAVAVSKDGVSRHHARILKKGDEYVLEDLRSTNGTFLNGQAVARDQLRHLDVIGLGKEAELIFVLRADEAKTIRKVVVLDASLLRDTPNAVPEALPVGEVTVGRSSACNIVAAQGAVSKIHCRIVRTQKQVTLEDLGSSNGTFVNGERVMTAVLHDGDNLTLGAVEVFKVKVDRKSVV
jgi:pSer/pThr/pTyr-binding forkhead associated (FHA) protein